MVRYASTHMSLIDRPPETNSLMECGRCMRLVHPSCETDYGVEGVIRWVITMIITVIISLTMSGLTCLTSGSAPAA